MLIPRVADILTIPQAERWARVLELCAMLGTEDDPVLFHGTSAIRASAIRREGFGKSVLSTPVGVRQGVHWGSLDLATWAAESKMEADDPPAIMYARLSSILTSGEPHADVMYEDGIEGGPLVDWRDGLARTGSLCVAGGERVEGLRHVAVLGLPMHPRAAEVRSARLAGRMDRPGTPRTRTIPPALAIDETTTFAVDGDVDLAGCLFYCPKEASAPGAFR